MKFLRYVKIVTAFYIWRRITTYRCTYMSFLQKVSRNRPRWPKGFRVGYGPGFSWRSALRGSSALRIGRLYPRRKTWYSFLEAESIPGHMVLSVATEKSSVTPPGIDPETFRLVAQCLKHCATPGLSYLGTDCKLVISIARHTVKVLCTLSLR